MDHAQRSSTFSHNLRSIDGGSGGTMCDRDHCSGLPSSRTVPEDSSRDSQKTIALPLPAIRDGPCLGMCRDPVRDPAIKGCELCLGTYQDLVRDPVRDPVIKGCDQALSGHILGSGEGSSDRKLRAGSAGTCTGIWLR
eukprot:g38602.t1